MHLSGTASASLSEDVQQRVTDSLALHADGNFEATQWLMQIGRQPELLALLRWLLHPASVFPPLSVESKTFAALTRKEQEALGFQQTQHGAHQASPQIEALTRAAGEAYLLLDETAKLAAFQLLLEAVKKPQREWSDEERRGMEEAVLAFVHCASPEALRCSPPTNAPPAATAAAAVRRAPPLSLLMKASQSLAALHCCTRRSSENALSERLLLLQLAVWSTGLSTEALAANALLRGRALGEDLSRMTQEFVADRERELQQLPPEQRQQRFVAACVFLGVLKELGQELQDVRQALFLRLVSSAAWPRDDKRLWCMRCARQEEGSLVNALEPRARRAKVAELRGGLAEETLFLLQICRFLLALHSREAETRRRIQPLALDCIRQVAFAFLLGSSCVALEKACQGPSLLGALQVLGGVWRAACSAALSLFLGAGRRGVSRRRDFSPPNSGRRAGAAAAKAAQKDGKRARREGRQARRCFAACLTA